MRCKDTSDRSPTLLAKRGLTAMSGHLLKKAALVSIAWFVANNATAAAAYHVGQLKAVYPQGDGSFVVIFSSNPPQCASPNSPSKYLYVAAGQNGVTAEGLKNMLATALTAFALELPVYIAYDDATAYCYINRLSAER